MRSRSIAISRVASLALNRNLARNINFRHRDDGRVCVRRVARLAQQETGHAKHTTHNTRIHTRTSSSSTSVRRHAMNRFASTPGGEGESTGGGDECFPNPRGPGSTRQVLVQLLVVVKASNPYVPHYC